MYQDFSYDYRAVLGASHKAAWTLDEVLGPGDRLDFARPFLPETLARTAAAPGLDAGERRILNQIRGHEYLSIFALVEEFILPFLLDHARPQLSGDDWRVRALLNFAGEEAKHIQLFKRFQRAFAAGFGTPCPVIGPGRAIAVAVLRHDPLAVALLVLHIEWMTQGHYLDSVRDDAGLDPLFKSLLRHHWLEEAQHARLDTLIVEALAEGRTELEIGRAIDGYFEIAAFIDAALRRQAEFNLIAFEQAAKRRVRDRGGFVAQQHAAARWTFLGSGMSHRQFRATLGAISPAARDRVDAAAPAFR